MESKTSPFLVQFSEPSREHTQPPALRTNEADGMLYLVNEVSPLIEAVLAGANKPLSRAASRWYFETMITKAQWDQVDPNVIRPTMSEHYEI